MAICAPMDDTVSSLICNTNTVNLLCTRTTHIFQNLCYIICTYCLIWCALSKCLNPYQSCISWAYMQFNSCEHIHPVSIVLNARSTHTFTPHLFYRIHGICIWMQALVQNRSASQYSIIVSWDLFAAGTTMHLAVCVLTHEHIWDYGYFKNARKIPFFVIQVHHSCFS